MSMYPNPSQARPWQLDYSADQAVSTRFMNQVYAWMCVGLATTAVVAWLTSSSPQAVRAIFHGGTYLMLVVAEIALVLVISYAINRINATMATILFVVYSALNGVTLSVIFLVYALPAVGGAFVITAGMFAAMSIYGYVTKRDLTSLGSFMLMGLIGLILASVVNIFVASSGLYWIITYAGVLIFLGLTAYDTQKLKAMSYQVQANGAMAARLSVIGSLMLYLDFINLFLFILRILGRRR